MPAADYRCCQQCSARYTRPPRRSATQWARMRFCSTRCGNTWRARQQRPALSTQRAWALAWERQRAIQDRAEIKAWKPKVWPHSRLSQAPQPRQFVAAKCQAPGCNTTWIQYANRKDGPYCKRCNRARWRETHYERAARHGALFEVIDPIRIFERDRWRCQLCGDKTQRTGWPNPKRATLDHIVPLSRGGDHVESNLQCACWVCNARKGARSANDQLRLAI